MINSKICDLIGIRYPVFQGGMAWISDGKLAAAVSNGGGLGIIAAGGSSADYVREQIRIARSLTDKPFGVNIMMRSPYVADVAQVVTEEKVAVITTGAGNPAKYMDAWLANDSKVIPVIASVAMAVKMERVGASAVVAEGTESGGHIGELTTMALVPQVCDAVSIPVLAAGGIADGRGAAAAFMLGASGVQMGTRFLAASECSIHENYKEKLLSAGDLSTIVTGRRLGHPIRSLRTPFSRDYAQLEYTDISDEEMEAKGAGVLKLAAENGDIQNGCFMAGQIAGLVNKEQPAAEIISEVMTEAEEILKGITKWVK